MSVPTPVLPEYASGCLSGIIPVLCAPGGPRQVPAWMPGVVQGAERIVLLLLDGLGWNQFESHASLMPTLSQFGGSHIPTVAPSTPATAPPSLVTGLAPGQPGNLG